MDAWTPKVGTEWRSTSVGLVYVSASRGVKGGGYNSAAREPGGAFAPESATTVEAGVKRSFGGAWVHALAFHTDHRDLQVQTTIRDAEIHPPGLVPEPREIDLQLAGTGPWPRSPRGCR